MNAKGGKVRDELGAQSFVLFFVSYLVLKLNLRIKGFFFIVKTNQQKANREAQNLFRNYNSKSNFETLKSRITLSAYSRHYSHSTSPKVD
jgi:hypothetical protein